MAGLFRDSKDRKPDLSDPGVLYNNESVLKKDVAIRQTMKILTSFPDAWLNAAQRSLVVALPQSLLAVAQKRNGGLRLP